MLPCIKPKVNVFAIRFNNRLTSGIKPDEVYKLDRVFNDAVEENKQDEILNFKDEKDRTVFHLAAEHGQPVILEWCIAKWKTEFQDEKIKNALKQPDSNGMTPLVSACYRGCIN
jgi:ankyrin repeat protein